MATSKLNQFMENVDEQLECAICLKRLQNPRSLNCLHSFCLTCLKDWVKTKGTLSCPTCSRLHEIPEGGLQALPLNIVLNNILETVEKFSENYERKCVCGAEGEAYSYCQDCNEYLCSTCSAYHKKLSVLADHKLLLITDMQSMSPTQFASLQPPKCMVHTKAFEFYCTDCKHPICVNCAILGHNQCEGKSKPVSISEAFQTFKETSAELEKSTHRFKIKLQVSLNAIVERATKLEQTKDSSLRDIENHVEELIEAIKKNGEKMKTEVEAIYKQKKKGNDVEIDEFETVISDINTRLSFLNHLLKCDEATALQSSDNVTKGLQERIKHFPIAEPDDNGEIHYLKHQQVAMIQDCNIGKVKYSGLKAADCLKLEKSLVNGAIIIAKVDNSEACKIDLDQLIAVWTNSTGSTSNAQIKKADNEDYLVVIEKCRSEGVCRLDVSIDGNPIKNSPLTIEVIRDGLVNVIGICSVFCTDIINGDDDSFYIAAQNVDECEILMYHKSGKFKEKIRLPKGMGLNKMYKMINSIALTDPSNNCIRVLNMDGEVIKTIGKGVLKKLSGIYVNEASNIAYVVDYYKGVFMFNIVNGKMIRKLGSGSYVTLTNQGHILMSYSRVIKLFDNDGQFIRILIKRSDQDEGSVRNPRGIVVDSEDNIIVLNENKLELFNKNGTFIKRIDDPANGIAYPTGLSIISHNPRQVAVLVYNTVKIFNY